MKLRVPITSEDSDQQSDYNFSRMTLLREIIISKVKVKLRRIGGVEV
jgi:ribosomal protein S18